MRVISAATQISQTFKNAGRATEILGVLVKHGFADLIHRMRLSRFLPAKYSENNRYKNLPVQERLRLSFEELGPTFVKLGQLLATRPDLIPESFVEEFELLQDKVAGVSFEEIRRVVETELKAPIEAIFSEFDEEPMAAASIAQVHAARLRTGEHVAVKVQRPGIERLISNDLSILRTLAVALEKYVEESRVLNPTGLVEEFVRTILFELDFRVEANNIRRIKKNLSDLTRIAIPEVYSQFSTGKLLVLERFYGVRFNDREAIVTKGINPVEIVEEGTNAFFHMVMRDGVFHGDLHGGNLFVLEDGRIGIIDFGIVGRLGRRVQDSIMVMFTAIVDEDFDTLASEYMNLCQVTGAPDYGQLQKDLMDTISPYIGMSLGEVNVGKILLRSTAIATKHNLVVPRELMLLFRAILTIEALGKKLDPSFDLLPLGIKLARQTLAARYSKERLMRDFMVVGRDLQSLLETTPRLLRRSMRKWAQNDFVIETRNKDSDQLVRSLRHLGYAILLAALAWGGFGVGVAFLFLDRGPHLSGLPVFALVTFGVSLIPLLHGILLIRKQLR